MNPISDCFPVRQLSREDSNISAEQGIVVAISLERWRQFALGAVDWFSWYRLLGLHWSRCFQVATLEHLREYPIPIGTC